MDPNRWTLSNMDDHPVEEVRVSSKKLNNLLSKLKKEHLTIFLTVMLGLVIVGVMYYFLISKNRNSAMASNIPANNSPIEVPASVPDSTDNTDSSFVQPVPPQQQAVLGANTTATASPSATPSDTPSPTPSPTDTPSPTPTDTPTPTETPTPTPTPTSTPQTASGSATQP